MLIRLTEENLWETLKKATAILEAGGVIAYPTETFYGLGAGYDNPDALQRIYEIKERPQEKAMPLIIGDREALSLLTAEISASACRLMEKFWPGPLTLLLKAREGLQEKVISEGKVAVRMPGESFGLWLARAAGFPITATSANPSGMPPAATGRMVSEYFGDRLDLIIDSGKTAGGLPSTIVDATGDELIVLRKGAVNLLAQGED
ncbi:MAG: threonylcarbamoyl-AMP synthase [Nitrospirales bacterium]|nr:threonylcarbamoyl-AMP synthase [Nitrospirales bacterium]